MRFRLSATLLLIAAWPACGACAAEDVVLYDSDDVSAAGGAPLTSGGAAPVFAGGAPVDPGGSGGATAADGGGDDAGVPCRSSADCAPSFTCEKSDCGAHDGTCEPRPILCDEPPRPVCGCDHVTYWNGCIRRQAGASADTPGECRGGARLCSAAADCGVADASCSLLMPPGGQCGQTGPGVCWVTPLVCNQAGDPQRWAPCIRPAPGGPPPPCVDTCTAIQAGVPHFPLPPGVFCPGP